MDNTQLQRAIDLQGELCELVNGIKPLLKKHARKHDDRLGQVISNVRFFPDSISFIAGGHGPNYFEKFFVVSFKDLNNMGD